MARKLSSFGAAFAKARKEQGTDGVFTYKGKKYSTRRADDPKKSRTAPMPKRKPSSKAASARPTGRLKPASGRKPSAKPASAKPASAKATSDKAASARPTGRLKPASKRPRRKTNIEDTAAIFEGAGDKRGRIPKNVAAPKKIARGKDRVPVMSARSGTPREVLSGKTHKSSSKLPGKRVPRAAVGAGRGTVYENRDLSGHGPGDTKHPGMGLKGAMIRKAGMDSARNNPADARRMARMAAKKRRKPMPMDNEEENKLMDSLMPMDNEENFSYGGMAKKKPTKKMMRGGMAKKPVKKNMGGMMNYSKGGKVRGYGMAKGGRPCKMVSMKGS
tara:strand:+ start:1203 stop:2195 length:993 start_codon:yes stop_codon:yes gene_type:complete